MLQLLRVGTIAEKEKGPPLKERPVSIGWRQAPANDLEPEVYSAARNLCMQRDGVSENVGRECDGRRKGSQVIAGHGRRAKTGIKIFALE